MSRSAAPNRNSASVLASSVLPVPVGPANKNTPMGLPGSLRPAFNMAMRSTMVVTASVWPITRASKYLRIEARSARSLLSRSAAGMPVACDRLTITLPGVTALLPSLSALPTVVVRRSSTEPGRLVPLKYCLAALSAVPAQSGPIFRRLSAAMCVIAALAMESVSSLESGSKRIVSNRLRSWGRKRNSRAAPAADASVQTISRPEVMAGRICSSMLAVWP